MAVVELDYMEYANDVAAQAAYVSNAAVPMITEFLNGDVELWTGGDTNPPDNWDALEGAGASIAKESTIVEQGSYSAGITRSGADTTLPQNDLHIAQGIGYWQGKTVTFGAWVYATVANRAEVYVWDGATVFPSSYHSGDSTWQFLTVTATLGGGASNFGAGFRILNGDTTAYFDGALLAEGSLLYYLQSYSEDTIKEQGDYSLKGIATITNSLNKTLTRTVDPTIDLSDLAEIKYGIYSDQTGSNIKIGIHDSGGTTSEHTANISSAGAWETQTWDISGISNANKDGIDSIIITIVNADAANTFYIDNMYGQMPTLTISVHDCSDIEDKMGG